jgi:adenylosuccinate synthase
MRAPGRNPSAPFVVGRGMSKAIIVAGLGFGDEGKGTIVDALTAETGSTLVVRYNGGCQAQHNVVLPDGRHHTFSQFGSGTLAGTRTHLSKYMLVDPFALMMEAEHLAEFGVDALGSVSTFPSMLTIDRDAPVITAYHREANRKREEARGASAHGSCGRGIGECRLESMTDPDYLRVGDLGDLRVLEEKLARGLDALTSEFGPMTAWSWDPKRYAEALYMVGRALPTVDGSWLPEQMRTGTTIFEGAQGVLLDQTYGFQPHTTWSDCTFAWALDLLAGFDGEVERIGVTRAYHTRHGAGPLPTEMTPLPFYAERHNVGGFAGAFRQGHLDIELLRYAIATLGGLDGLAVTHLDRSDITNMCVHWSTPDSPGLIESDRIIRCENPTFERQCELTKALTRIDPRTLDLEWIATDGLAKALADEFDTPVRVESRGPTRADKVMR